MVRLVIERWVILSRANQINLHLCTDTSPPMYGAARTNPAEMPNCERGHRGSSVQLWTLQSDLGIGLSTDLFWVGHFVRLQIRQLSIS